MTHITKEDQILTRENLKNTSLKIQVQSFGHLFQDQRIELELYLFLEIQKSYSIPITRNKNISFLIFLKVYSSVMVYN